MSQMQFGLEQPAVKAKSSPKVLSVSQINRLIKNQLEGEFSTVWLQGELSNFKAHTSGHFYFSLKDSKAQISAVMFRGQNSKLKFKPTVGMEVIVRGRITVYEPRGNYQMLCEAMEPVGAGALQQAFEQLKNKLRTEGLFNKEHKKALPILPKHIALVTAPTGAAVQDMLNVLGRRSQSVNITVVPCLVQGEAAPASIVKALVQANQIDDVDVIIVGRGGGSMEDLWGFNSELVARAIYACKKPVISAVGHEVDFTISDFVADLRAPTPSAAAELVVENTDNLLETLDSYQHRLNRAFNVKVESLKQKITGLEKRLIDPRRHLQDLTFRLDELITRLENATNNKIQQTKLKVQALEGSLKDPKSVIDQKRSQLEVLQSKLTQELKTKIDQLRLKLNTASVAMDSMSPLKVVDRGYSIATVNKKVIKKSSQVKKGDTINVKLAKGEVLATVDSIIK